MASVYALIIPTVILPATSGCPAATSTLRAWQLHRQLQSRKQRQRLVRIHETDHRLRCADRFRTMVPPTEEQLANRQMTAGTANDRCPVQNMDDDNQRRFRIRSENGIQISTPTASTLHTAYISGEVDTESLGSTVAYAVFDQLKIRIPTPVPSQSNSFYKINPDVLL